MILNQICGIIAQSGGSAPTTTTTTTTSSTTTTTTSIPVVAQFNFNLTARSVTDWTDITGHPHLAIRSGTSNGITVSTRATTYWTNLAATTAVQSGGEETANPTYYFPQNCTLDYFFSNQTTCLSGDEQLEVSGLTPLAFYTVEILGSRNNANVSDSTRQVRYVIRHNGTRTTLSPLDVKGNTANVATMVNVQADATGTFWIGSYGNNENVNAAFAYFNALKITEE